MKKGLKFNFLDRGIYLEQHKEPAFSHPLQVADGIRFADIDLEQFGGLTQDYLYKVVELSKIVDEHTGTPLLDIVHAALQHPPRTLVINAVDGDPYTSSSVTPMFQLKEYALFGARLLKRVVRAQKISIAVNSQIDIDGSFFRFPDKVDGIEVRKIDKKYPQATRLQDCYLHPIVAIGTGALINFAKTIVDGAISHLCFVTVAGDCVLHPANLVVNAGTPIGDLFEHCGICKTPEKVILGSVMNGRAVEGNEIGVEQASKSVIALSHPAIKTGLNCIGCGRCVRVCPQGLAPYYLYKAAKRGIDEPALLQMALRCDQCGCCSYVCPGTCNPTHYIRLYKLKAQTQAERKENA